MDGPPEDDDGEPDDGDWGDERQTAKRCFLSTFSTHGAEVVRELKPGDPFLEQIKGLNFCDPAEVLRQNAPRGPALSAVIDFYRTEVPNQPPETIFAPGASQVPLKPGTD
jgi:hypothetical protein